MAGIKISALPSAALPLTGAEVTPIVQTGNTVKVPLNSMFSASTGSSQVGFVASGTGATLRTVQAKLRDVVNVKDFGAVGDGVTDDTTAIQNALNSGAGLVIAPAGTYKVTSLNVPSYTVLSGAGKNSTVISCSTSSGGITFTNTIDAGLCNLQVSASAAAYAVHVVSSSTYSMRPIFENLFVSGFSSSGIGIFFDVQGANPIYFPRLYNLDVDGGSPAPSVGTRIGVAFGGAGSTVTVGGEFFGARITNTLFGISHNKSDSVMGFGVQLDGQTNGASGGVGLLFTSGGGGYNKYFGTRFESTAVDVFVSFNAGSSDNFVEGVMGGATPSKIQDAGVRNSWSGSDGSGGLIDRQTDPVNLVNGIQLAGGTRLSNYVEGVFTPVVVGGSTAGTATYSYQTGEYTRIGNKVFFSASISFSGHTGTGAMNITGLPITPKIVANMRWTCSLNVQSMSFTGPSVYASIFGGDSTIYCSQTTAAGVASAIPIAASGALFVTGFYEV